MSILGKFIKFCVSGLDTNIKILLTFAAINEFQLKLLGNQVDT